MKLDAVFVSDTFADATIVTGLTICPICFTAPENVCECAGLEGDGLGLVRLSIREAPLLLLSFVPFILPQLDIPSIVQKLTRKLFFRSPQGLCPLPSHYWPLQMHPVTG